VCREQKPLSEFYRQPQRRDGHLGTCRQCVAARVAERQTADAVKQCRQCQQVKPLVEFHVNHLCADGRVSRCRACVNARAREWRQEHAERVGAYERARAKLPHRKAAVIARRKRRRQLIFKQDQDVA